MPTGSGMTSSCRFLLSFGFQRKTGYVQQQDLHLETATVVSGLSSLLPSLKSYRPVLKSSSPPQREAVQFAAILRQSRHVPREEKLAYAEEILVLLGMDKYADAIVGVAGEGLNVEERKRLSIGEFSSSFLNWIY